MFGSAIPLGILDMRLGVAPPPPPPPPVPPPVPPPPPPPPPGGATTYINGYTYRRTMHIPAGVFTADHQRFPLYFDETDLTLRSVANGGHVQHPSGWDIRFEQADGTKISHDLERYVATTGEIVAWLLINATAANAQTIYVYYGKTGLVASEASPATVWADYLAVYHLPSTVEAGGRTSRNLTSIGTVGTDNSTMFGQCMSVTGTGLLKLDNVNWLDSLSALTVQVRVRPL